MNPAVRVVVAGQVFFLSDKAGCPGLCFRDLGQDGGLELEIEHASSCRH